mmetsp:Transcript_13825/g.42841  ORF Transcript_13825/g.42841 Transcript_13825/m.42841 type:complete len:286 (-) Transcript_13825:184-1041(-)
MRRTTILLAAALVHAAAAFPGQRTLGHIFRRKPPPKDELPETEGLIGLLGSAIYEYVDTPSIHLTAYLTLGIRYNERSALYVVSTLCNWLYGCAVFWGFVVFPRGRMLAMTALTFPVGPSIVLVLLGGVAGINVAFATRPMASVALLWILWFLPSKIAQKLGLYMGLDADGDGDVDVLDVLAALAATRVGAALRLQALHVFLNRPRPHPFAELFERLDRLEAEPSFRLDVARRLSRLESTGTGDEAGPRPPRNPLAGGVKVLPTINSPHMRPPPERAFTPEKTSK